MSRSRTRCSASTVLVDTLDGNKAHGRPRHRFGNGLGIVPIVFFDFRLGLPNWGAMSLT
jgi:hypothetical protein